MNKFLKNTIISGIVLGTIGSCSIVNADTNKDVVTSRYEVYAYDRDDFSSEKIGILDANRDVYRILCGNDLDLVNSGNYLFFVDKNNLDVKESNNIVNYNKLNTNGVATTEVNLRVGPSTNDNIITTLDGGCFLEIIGITDNGWYLVDYNNLLGFIYSPYIKEINLDDINSQVANLPSIIKIVEANTELNVRSGPSTDYDKIATVSKGFKMSFNNRLDNGWYEVEKNGNIGYVSGDYVKEKYVIDSECLQFVSLKKEANLYNEPFGNVVSLLPKYEMCRVYGKIDDYYYVVCDGNIGFVYNDNCEKLSGTFVVVDISDQKMTVYNDTDEVLTSDVVTGKDSTPTSIGLFSVLEKDSPKELVGDDYDVWVDYWLRFYKGQGLHDLKRSEYGGEIYHNYGSHGCVNLPKKVAKELYRIVDEGDQVLVKR